MIKASTLFISQSMAQDNTPKLLTRMSHDCYGQVPAFEAQQTVDELNLLTPATWATSSVGMFMSFDGNDTPEPLEPGYVWVVTNVVME